MAARRNKVPVTLCGEMAGRPLEAMALVGLGLRSLSMSPASLGPVKSMILSLDAGRLSKHLDGLLMKGQGSLRAELKRWAEAEGVEI